MNARINRQHAPVWVEFMAAAIAANSDNDEMGTKEMVRDCAMVADAALQAYFDRFTLNEKVE